VSLFPAIHAVARSVKASTEFQIAQEKLRLTLSSDAVELAAEMARTTFLNQLQAIDAVRDCWAYDGRSLAKTRETIVRADKAGLSVRAMLQMEALRKQVPEPVGDRPVQTLLAAPYVEGRSPTPSDFRRLGNAQSHGDQ
jgi:hypothetical protein